MKSPSKRTERHGNLQALTIQRLNQLTKEDLQALAEFAERRMDWLPSAPFSAEDMVHKAIHAIIRGTRKHGEGRRPRRENVRTKEAFLHYIRSATNSVIEATKRRRELWVIHEAIHREKDFEEEQRLIVLTALPGPEDDAALVDLRNELFARLRKIAPASLHPTLAEWEKVFLWETQVPPEKERKYRDQVRKLAVRVLRQLIGELKR